MPVVAQPEAMRKDNRQYLLAYLHTNAAAARRILIALCFCASCSSFADADLVANMIVRARQLHSVAQHAEAMALLDALLTNDGPTIQAALGPARDPNVEPLGLVAGVLRVSCLNCLQENFTNDVALLLERYRIPAQNNAWMSYAWLYDFMGYHYRRTKDFEALEDVITNALQYSAVDGSLPTFIMELLQNDPAQHQAPLERIFAVYDTARSTSPSPSIEALRCVFLKQYGGDAFAAGISFLQHNLDTSRKDLEVVVPVMCRVLDLADRAQIDSYRRALLNFAIRQPATDTRIPVIAYVLNEKKKLDAVLAATAPPCTNRPATSVAAGTTSN